MKLGKILLILLLAAVGGVVLVGGCFYGGYNKAIGLDESVQGAWAEVDNQLQRRFEMIPNLIETVKGFAGQEKDIFLGVITNWSEVGGPDALIDVLVREESDSNTKILRDGIFGDAEFTPGSVVMDSEGDTKRAMIGGTNTISYVAYSGIRLEDVPINALIIDEYDPATSADYPFTRQLGGAYLPANAEKVQPIVNFLTSPEVTAMLAEYGIAPAD